MGGDATRRAQGTGGVVDAALQSFVAALWPEMSARLGDRSSTFFATAARRMKANRIVGREAAARYLNLCFVLGPAFEERPENEWALALLLDGRVDEWTRLHQLVTRSVTELTKRGVDSVPLVAADITLLDKLDLERLDADADAEPLARKACDLEALYLRMLDAPWRREYQHVGGPWELVSVAMPYSLQESVRVDRSHPVPAHLSLLSHAPGDGPAAQLQVRQLMHAGCGERHPGLRFIDNAGLSRWHGHHARAVSWAVHAMPQPAAASGFSAVLMELTSPAIHLLDASSCALRDEGVPVGLVATQLWAYPAEQWLFTMHREAGAPQVWPRTQSGEAKAAVGASSAALGVEPGAATPATTRGTHCHVERDGDAVDSAGWSHAFDDGLPAAMTAGLDRLFEAWKTTATEPVMHGGSGLLVGNAALSWGWKEGADGLASDPLMRVVGSLNLRCALDIMLSGEVSSGATRTQVRLSARGTSSLAWSVARESADMPLLETLLMARVPLRFPFTIDADPIATVDGSMLSDCGPCVGAVVGEAGLRPRSGGSGWQWFVKLDIEPVFAPVTVHDPVLGSVRRSLALLPAAPLVDWSAG